MPALPASIGVLLLLFVWSHVGFSVSTGAQATEAHVCESYGSKNSFVTIFEASPAPRCQLLTTSPGAPIDEFFTGLVDNVRIYTTKLSHHDSAAIFTCEGGDKVTCDTDATTGHQGAGATAATGATCVFPFKYMGKMYNH
jgi:hypothetical protein